MLLRSGHPRISCSRVQLWPFTPCPWILWHRHVIGRQNSHRSMLEDAVPNVRQELLWLLSFDPQPMDPVQAWEAFKTAPQVVKVVSQPPLKPQPPKLTLALALAQPSSTAQQSSSQASHLKQKGKLSSSTTKVATGRLWLFQDQLTQKQDSYSHNLFPAVVHRRACTNVDGLMLGQFLGWTGVWRQDPWSARVVCHSLR